MRPSPLAPPVPTVCGAEDCLSSSPNTNEGHHVATIAGSANTESVMHMGEPAPDPEQPAQPMSSALPDGVLEHIDAPDISQVRNILRKAAELLATGSPSEVSLRRIAKEAGVSYSLIHRHFGSKEALVFRIFQAFTDYGDAYTRASPDIYEAVRQAFYADSGAFAQIFSWAVVDRADPERVWPGPTSNTVLTEHIQHAWDRQLSMPETRPVFDARVVSAFINLIISLWDFYAPYMQVMIGYPERDAESVKTEILELIQLLVHAAAPPADTPDVSAPDHS
jgi:AcrR family transcriptional regulator